MVQVINNPSLSTMLGSQLGSGVGEGLSKGLEQLAALRSSDLLKRQQHSAYTGLGYTPEEAALFSLVSVPKTFLCHPFAQICLF